MFERWVTPPNKRLNWILNYIIAIKFFEEKEQSGLVRLWSTCTPQAHLTGINFFSLEPWTFITAFYFSNRLHICQEWRLDPSVFTSVFLNSPQARGLFPCLPQTSNLHPLQAQVLYPWTLNFFSGFYLSNLLHICQEWRLDPFVFLTRQVRIKA